MISLIAAIGKNNELGKGNTLLWHMPEDMKHFRETTSGHAVIMGRKTFESLGKPLPNRRNIVITRDVNYQKEGVEIVHSIDGALKLFKNTAEEIFIIGGAEIYKQSISVADKLYITHIKAEDKDADVFFPVIDSTWKEVFREEHGKDEKNIFSYTFTNYEKF
ncbi:MAG: dihydrofolate reductase [Parcubacteria group bacterium Gr01-1014_24]|nr:MAG: dihydrofolate reductase [Parcubacteria group bacterium Gr01-1014_24]